MLMFQSIPLSRHAMVRMRQRCLPAGIIQWILRFGSRFYVGNGRELYWLSRRAVIWARDRFSIRLDEYTNWAVIVSPAGSVVTAFKASRRERCWRGGGR